MYKLARAYLHNLSVASGVAFDDFELDFRNSNEQASNFLINLANGGGKTTMLSLIYSTLLPEKNYFIPQRSGKKNISIDDYVQDEPAFIMLEFECPDTSSLYLQKEKLIIIQNLRKTKSNLVRNFATFVPVDFAYDECKTSIKNDSKFESLKEQILKSKSHQLFFTPYIEEHLAKLADYGFDKDILRLCVDFNTMEGGIAKFAKYSSHKDFLAKMFFLLIDSKQRSDLLNEIKENKQRLEKKPKEEKKLQFLNNFLQIIENLDELKQEKEQKNALKNEILTNLFNHRDFLDSKQQEIEKKVNYFKNQEKIQEKKHEELEQAKENLLAQKEFFEFKKIEKNLIDLTNSMQENERKISEKELEIHNISAKKQELICVKLHEKLTEKQEILKQENLDLLPLEKQKDKAEKLLRDKVNYTRLQLNSKTKELNAQVDLNLEKIKEVEQEISENDKLIGSLENEKKNLNQIKNKFHSKKDELIKEKILKIDENLDDCLKRLKEQKIADEKQKCEAELEKKQIEAKKEALFKQKVKLEEKIKILSEQEAKTKVKIDECKQKERELWQNKTLLECANYEPNFNLDQNLQKLLNFRLNEVKKQLKTSEEISKNLDKKINILEDTKTPLINEITKRALDLLRGKISGVGYFLHYLNSVDKANVKQYLSRNPSLYLGLYVNDKNNIEKAKNILKENNFSDVVFINEVEFESEIKDNFYLDDRYFDIDNYNEILNQLNAQLNAEKDYQNSLQIQEQKLCDAHEKLKEFLQNYEPKAMEIELNSIKTSINECKKALENLLDDEEKCHKNESDLNTLINSLTISISNFDTNKEKIKNILELNYDENALIECQNKILNIQNQQEKNIETKQEISLNLEQIKARINKNKKAIDELPSVVISDEFDEISPKDIQTLYDDFQKECDACKRFMQEKNLDFLSEEIEKLQNELASEQEQLNKLKNDEKFNHLLFDALQKCLDLEQELQNSQKDLENFKNENEGFKGKKSLIEEQKSEKIKNKIYAWDDFLLRGNLDELIAKNILDLEENEKNYKISQVGLQELSNEIENFNQLHKKSNDEFMKTKGFLANYANFVYQKCEIKNELNFECEQEKFLKNNAALDEIDKQIQNQLQEYKKLASKEKSEELRNFHNLNIDEILSLLQYTKNQITMTKECIATYESQMKFMNESLQNYLKTLTATLESIGKKSIIDERLSAIGGKHFIKIKNFDKTNTNLETILDFINSSDRLGNKKSDYDEFSADLIMKLNPNIAISIIKIDNIKNSYVNINELTSSGGETLTMALVLYLTIAKIKYAKIDKNMRFLLLDNPIGTANELNLIKTQLEYAKKLDFQLIYTTGLSDKNSQIVFANRINVGIFQDQNNKFLRVLKGMIKDEKSFD